MRRYNSHAGGPGFESLRAHHSNLSESVVCGFRSFPLLPSEPKNVSEPYQNDFVPEFRIKTLASPFLVGTAIQLGQGFPFHLKLHLRVLLKYLGVGLPQHLRDPLVGHATSTQTGCIS